jgi:hypothetical protein
MAANSWEQLIASWEPRMRQAFLDAVYEIRDSITIAELTRLIEAGRIDDAVRAVGLDPGKFRGMSSTLAAAYEAAGVATMVAIPPAIAAGGYTLKISFDARATAAAKFLRDRSELLIREITEDQRRGIRDVLVRGLESGRGPRDVATDLLGRRNRATGKREHGLIGLTQTQQDWARNYARELATGDPAALKRKMRDAKFDAVVRRAIAEGRGLTKAEALPAFRAYLYRALRVRADLIARMEMRTALHAAQDQAYRQAIDAGMVSAEVVTKEWRSRRDERVRDTHRRRPMTVDNDSTHWGLDGVVKQLDDYFISSSGARLRYPGDPSAPLSETAGCRCNLIYRVDFLKGIQ